MKYILFALVLLCICCRPIRETSKSEEIKKDSLIYIEKVHIDTLKIKADTIVTYLPCDDLKNQYFQSGRAKVKAEPKDNGYILTVTCDSLEKIIISRDTIIKQLTENIKQLKEHTVITLSKWQQFWIIMGKILTNILILILLWKLKPWKVKAL